MTRSTRWTVEVVDAAGTVQLRHVAATKITAARFAKVLRAQHPDMTVRSYIVEARVTEERP